MQPIMDEVDLRLIDVQFDEVNEEFNLVHLGCQHTNNIVTSIIEGDTLYSLIIEVQQHFRLNHVDGN